MNNHEKQLMHAMRGAVRKAPSGMSSDALAESLGKAYPTLMSELNESIPTHKLGLLDGLRLIELAQCEEAKLLIGQIFGCAYFRLPKVHGQQGRACRTMVQAVKEFGDIARAFDEAQDERSEGGAGITEAERQKIVHEGHEAVAKILEFIESIESDVGVNDVQAVTTS